MKRQIKATSIDGQVMALRSAVAASLPSPWPLSAQRKPIWDEILSRRGRDEWQAIDLRFAWDLIEVLVRLKEEKNHLQEEGSILDGMHGARENPRARYLRLLSKQATELGRYLRIHPASESEHPTKVTSTRQAERTA